MCSIHSVQQPIEGRFTMGSVAEEPSADNSQPPLAEAAKADSPRRTPRWRKETLLPEITQLALEGHTGEAIGRKLDLPKRTVNRWLHGLRQEWTAEAAEGAGEMFSVDLWPIRPRNSRMCDRFCLSWRDLV
jgi:hypothetical protein